MEYDVIIVGAGISGLSCAIELHNIATKNNVSCNIGILEKSAHLGGHILSGCLMNPRGLDKLLPDWKNILNFHPQEVVAEEFVFLTKKRHKVLLETISNQGNYILSLSQLVSKLGEYAISLGIDVLTSISVTDYILGDNNNIIGVKTGALGLNKSYSDSDQNYTKTPDYQEGYEIYSKQVVLAEGCRGSLTKKVIDHFQLDRFSSPQTYALGIKEVWTVPEASIGFVSHSIGFPLSNSTYGGGFLYTVDNNLIALGLIVGLDYRDTYLDPYLKFQDFKKHPYISRLLKDGKCLEYGAKTISEGGVQSLPRLSFPGGILIGESAGFVNTVSLKGSHLAIESGMLSAKAIFEWLQNLEKPSKDNIATHFVNKFSKTKYEATSYKKLIKKHILYKELYKIRNIRPAFNKGLFLGGIYYLFEKYILNHRTFWTLRNNIPDYKKLSTIYGDMTISSNASILNSNRLHFSYGNKFFNTITHKKQKIDKMYSSQDNASLNSKSQSIVLSNISHRHEQPSHLVINNMQLIYENNQKLYDNPETRYCPAGVYRMQNNNFIIQAQNCLHCKACDIKDPLQNINWTTPEGGNGPNYTMM